MKKLISFMLVITISILYVVQIFAADTFYYIDDDWIYDIIGREYIIVDDIDFINYPQYQVNTNQTNVNSNITDEEKEKAIYDLILKGLKDKVGFGNNYIDVSHMGLTEKESSLLANTYQKVLDDYPELFYVKSGYSYQSVNGIIYQFNPKYYNITLEDIDRMTKELETEINIALAQIEGVTDPVEKALILHDYLAIHCSYNWETATNQEENYDSYNSKWNIYGALVEKDAVCQGYALAYKALMDRAGVECKIIAKEGVHGWNIIKIGENWYHVDVTWDDPVPDKKGYCNHKYFLLSDNTIKTLENKHPNWDTEAPPCNDNTYESGWWAFNDTEYPFYKKDDVFYYIKRKNYWNATIYYGKLSETGTAIANISIPWGTGIVWANNCLYYVNANNELMCYDIVNKQNIFVGKIPFFARASQDGYYTEQLDGIGLQYDKQSNMVVAFSNTNRNELCRFPLKK